MRDQTTQQRMDDGVLRHFKHASSVYNMPEIVQSLSVRSLACKEINRLG